MIHTAHLFDTASAMDAARAAAEPAALHIIGVASDPDGRALPGWWAIAAWEQAVAPPWEGSRVAPAEAPLWWAGVPMEPAAPEPPAVPASISPLQARRALLAAGLLDDVEAALDRAPREIRLAWEYAVELRRDDPLLAAVAAALGLSAEQVDELFLAAVA